MTKPLYKGVVKVMAKMGISTIKSYCGAQIFEAVGLGQELVDKYFTWTPSRIGGIGLAEIAREAQQQHARAFPTYPLNGHTLEVDGQYQYRKDGELHLFNPRTIHLLQKAVPQQRLQNVQGIHPADRRSVRAHGDVARVDGLQVCVEADSDRRSGAGGRYRQALQDRRDVLRLDQQRSARSARHRDEPHRRQKQHRRRRRRSGALYVPMPNGDSKNSAIKQVASGRFGVTSYYLTQAKRTADQDGAGRQAGRRRRACPDEKFIRGSPRCATRRPGVGLISPPPHHDIYSIEDLAELIHDLKNANHHARISVKLVSEVGVGTIAAGVAKGHADVVLISGHDGGTGASPQTSIKHAGLPWELGLAETHQTLVLNNLRSRIAVETDGQLKTGRDVVIAALLGAEEFGFATDGTGDSRLHHDAGLPSRHLPGRRGYAES